MSSPWTGETQDSWLQCSTWAPLIASVWWNHPHPYCGTTKKIGKADTLVLVQSITVKHGTGMGLFMLVQCRMGPNIWIARGDIGKIWWGKGKGVCCYYWLIVDADILMTAGAFRDDYCTIGWCEVQSIIVRSSSIAKVLHPRSSVHHCP
jgi:hypothetical protein